MPHSRYNSLQSRTCLFTIFAALFLCASLCIAQSKVPKYDTSTEAKLKGTVEELKLPPKGSE
jgi:hypothetical protein